ncbi:MAG TPA: metal-dependent hydrolase [Gammaproteobacteria bacterium]|nr:metal-dependent hydrolase [Gammaproteobacteria bacterium]
MPNATAHKLGAAIVVGLTTAVGTHHQGKTFEKTATAGTLAYFLGTLPDLLEPATSPDHRQFFHSLAFLGLVGTGMYKLYQWEAEDEMERLIRFALLTVGGAYIVHLLMDSSTPKGLPIA